MFKQSHINLIEKEFIKRIYNFKNSINCFLIMLDSTSRLSIDLSYLNNYYNLILEHNKYIENNYKKLCKSNSKCISEEDFNEYNLKLEKVIILFKIYISKVSHLDLSIMQQDPKMKIPKNETHIKIELILEITTLIDFIEKHFTSN